MSIDPRLFFTYTKHPKNVDLRKEKQLFDQNFLIKFLTSKVRVSENLIEYEWHYITLHTHPYIFHTTLI